MEQKQHQHTLTTAAMLFRVVFSFSVLSLLMFFCSSSMIHLHILRFNKFKLYSLPSDTNKNFMFLLCNGILCIIFNSSGLIRPSPSADVDTNKQNVVVETSEAEITEQEQGNHHHEGEKEEEEDEEEEETCVMVAAGDEEDQGEAESDDDEEMLSLEELNKKCDDFIKKMKLEIRFEDA